MEKLLDYFWLNSLCNSTQPLRSKMQKRLYVCVQSGKTCQKTTVAEF